MFHLGTISGSRLDISNGTANKPSNSQSSGFNLQPSGTFPPGTTLSLDRSRVIVERFLAEGNLMAIDWIYTSLGGYAHVYVVTSTSNQQQVLKRITCSDSQDLVHIKNEIDIHVLYIIKKRIHLS